MAVTIQVRRDTSSAWAYTNPILREGEIGLEKDTLKLKVGDGVTAWASLQYAVDVPFSSGEQAKLSAIQAGAQVNPADLDGVPDSSSRKAMSVAEKAKLSAIQAGAQVNSITAVFGREGAITAQPGDYAASDIAETPTHKIMTASERDKLASIPFVDFEAAFTGAGNILKGMAEVAVLIGNGTDALGAGTDIEIIANGGDGSVTLLANGD